MSEIRTYQIDVGVPDDMLLVTAQLAIVTFIRADGTNGYAMHAKGDMPMTTYLGMTVLAQNELRKWNDE